MNKKLFIKCLLLCLLAVGCVPNSPVDSQPTGTQSTNNVLTPTTTNRPANLYTTTPPIATASSSGWESSEKCVTTYTSRPDTYQLTGVAVIRSLNGEILELNLSLLDLADGDVTEISTPNPVDFASVSPDRKMLAYMRFSTSTSKWELVLVDAKGEEQKILWSSDKDFSFQGWLNNHQIVIVQDSKFIIVDTIKDSQLSFSPPDFPDFDPYFSRFFISFDPLITKAIYKYSEINILDLSNKTIITRIKDGYDRAPIVSWRPSGEQAAVVATIPIEQNSRGLPDEIFIIENNGQIRQLTHLYDTFKLVLTIENLSWSPDGNKIAFWLHDDQANLTLMVVDYETGEAVNYCILNVTATSFPIDVSVPVWSPDGKYLMAENRYAADKNRILVVDPYNKIAFPITENASPVGWMASP